jgi:uncharacterized membrane protein
MQPRLLLLQLIRILPKIIMITDLSWEENLTFLTMMMMMMMVVAVVVVMLRGARKGSS